MVCRRCGAELPASSGPGRPRSYCSTGCRRAAEYEARRLQKALGDVEEQIRWCRFGWNCRTEADIPKFDAERQRLEERLRVVLDDGGTAVTGAFMGAG
jgi:hypothetical protein